MIRSILAALVLSVSFFIWPPGVVQAGHDRAEPQVLSFKAACRSVDVLFGYVDAQSDLKKAGAYWQEAVVRNACFIGPLTYGFFERVVTRLRWESEDTDVVIVEVHSRLGQAAFTWYSAGPWDAAHPNI